jgi:hypothetical protein
MRRYCVLVMLLFSIGVSSVAVHGEQKAYSMAISKRLVKLEVQVPEGRWIKAIVQEGDQLRIEDHNFNLTMAFVPVIQDGAVRIRTFRVDKHAGANESMHFVENLDVAIGNTRYTQKALGGFAIKVLKVMGSALDRVLDDAPLKGSCKADGEFSLEKGIVGRCCVSCEGTTTCGCAVEDSCGTCCSGMCCMNPV